MLRVNGWSVHLIQSRSVTQFFKFVFKHGYLTKVNFIKWYSLIMFPEMGVHSANISLIAIWKTCAIIDRDRCLMFDTNQDWNSQYIYIAKYKFNNNLYKYIHLFTSSQVFWALCNTHDFVLWYFIFIQDISKLFLHSIGPLWRCVQMQ